MGVFVSQMDQTVLVDSGRGLNLWMPRGPTGLVLRVMTLLLNLFQQQMPILSLFVLGKALVLFLYVAQLEP